MKREREIKLIRKRKKLNKRYSDFELGLLASEMNDFTYLLKSIQFPIENYINSESKKEKENGEKNENNEDNKNNSDNIIQLKEEKINSEEIESNDEYKDLKVNKTKISNKKKRK